MKTKYGYLGPKGTYCEEAVHRFLGQEKVEKIAYPRIEQVLSAVREGEISHGIVPLENSNEGTVNLTLDLLVNEPTLKITGEVILPIQHSLLVKPETNKSEIRIVYSHPQALAQCRKYLINTLPGVQFREVNSTAEAAQITADELGTAAIGSQQAAENYGLKILDGDIQDCKENQTRFIVISTLEEPVVVPAKTSLVISITDRPGGLYHILKEFALANINLTKIESRPAKKNLGDYLFFIDLQGHRQDPSVRECLKVIEDMAASFRILGSYPVWNSKTAKAPTENEVKTSLPHIRQDIDIIDYQIVELLAKRTQLVNIVGNIKNGVETIRDRSREKQIIQRVRDNAMKKGVSPELMEKVYGILFDHFVELQKNKKYE